MENNRVTVKIYGQEYVIAGAKPEEHIVRIAHYVDAKMREIEGFLKGGSASSLAALAAVNVADDYFTALETIEELKKKTEQLTDETAHYTQMWEEVKRSFADYKEEARDKGKQKEGLQDKLDEKDEEIKRLTELHREAEGNFFDLQMENVQLKSELQRYKKIMV